MASQSQVVDLLKPLGIRLTPQRLAIAEVVINSADHPTVREIFERVRAFFPYVTIATVYSTLATLEQSGIVRELPFQKHSRYDANLEPHANLVCIGCDSVIDAEVSLDLVAELEHQVVAESQFQVSSQRVDFYGWCSGCDPDRI